MRNKEQKYTLIMFGQLAWSKLVKSDFRTRNGQMLKYLNKDARIDRIIYINPYFYSVKVLSLLKNIVINLSMSLFSPVIGLKKIKNYPKITVLNPFNLKRFLILKKYFFRILMKFLDKEIICQEENILLWGYNPAEYEIFDLFPIAKKVFDTVDNWVEMDLDNPWYDKSKMVKGYQEICLREDIIIISNGRAMTEYYSKIRGNKTSILEIPNGINTEVFSPQKYEKADIPKELINCKRPIIGYVGVVQERFDLELFQCLLKDNPDYTFVIVGPIISFRNFKFNINAPNLFYLGPKRYSEIPRYIYSFDVCIIPHKVDNMTTYMNPMKIYEYLAMGKPVVTNPLSGIDDVAQYCNIAEDYNSFNDMIKKSPRIDKRYISNIILKNYSWKKKVSSILNHCCPV